MTAGIAGSYLLQSTLHWDISLSGNIMNIATLFSAGVGVFFGYIRRAKPRSSIRSKEGFE